MGQIPVPLFYYNKEEMKNMANGSIAEVIADLARKVADLETAVNELNAQMATRSVTTTTPPTADGTGLPGFVILDAKPATEYQNYVYIYPKE